MESSVKDFFGKDSNRFDQEPNELTDQSSPQILAKNNAGFFQVQNYVEVQSKQKEEYIQTAQKISYTFRFDLKLLKTRYKELYGEKSLNNCRTIDKTQFSNWLGKFNESKDFFRSFTGWTRKSHQKLFLVIIKEKKEKKNDAGSENSQPYPKLKILFINECNNLLHIYSNLTNSDFEKIGKIITKHFTKLEFLCILNQNALDVQQGIKLLTLLKQIQRDQKSDKDNKNKIKQPINYVYVGPKAQSLSSWVKSQDSPFNKQENFRFFIARQNISSNSSNFNEHSIRQQIANEQQKNILDKYSELYELDSFIMKHLIKDQNFKYEVSIQNSFFNSIYAFYFNLLCSLKNERIQDMDPEKTKDLLNQEITKSFIKSISKYQASSSENQLQKQSKYGKNLCFLSLQQISKKCIVCKSSKPKYGCSKCCLEFKQDVHLCVHPCFKEFHLNKLKYLIPRVSIEKPSGLPKNGVASKFCISQKGANNVQWNQIPSVLKNSVRREEGIEHQSLKRFRKIRLIKKTAKNLVEKFKIRSSRRNGISVYNFLSEEDIEEEGMAVKLQIEQKQQNLLLKIQAIDQQSPSTDSLCK